MSDVKIGIVGDGKRSKRNLVRKFFNRPEVNKETIYKGCVFAIFELMEKGSVAFATKDEDGNRQVVEWFDLLDALNELCEIREEN